MAQRRCTPRYCSWKRASVDIAACVRATAFGCHALCSSANPCVSGLFRTASPMEPRGAIHR
eukprot:11712223-Alexandrium_andersonii.AAC.1